MTNYFDPDTSQTRLALIALMLVSRVLAASIPHAFDSHGWAVATAYVVPQVGRSLYASGRCAASQ